MVNTDVNHYINKGRLLINSIQIVRNINDQHLVILEVRLLVKTNITLHIYKLVNNNTNTMEIGFNHVSGLDT